MKDILLTFTGFHDPYSMGLVGEEEQAGPILSLVSARRFDHIILFATSNTEDRTIQTKAEIEKRVAGVEIEIRNASLFDPTDYAAIFRALRRHIRELIEKHPDAAFSISVASGTPHARMLGSTRRKRGDSRKDSACPAAALRHERQASYWRS